MTSRKIVLLGLMGSGKSTIGGQVSFLSRFPYLDNDVLLTSDGASRAELAESGRLHAEERRVIASVLENPGPFVAGAAASVIEDAATRSLIEERAFGVYLHVPVAVLADRLKDDTDRPYLRPDPAAAIAAMYATRDPLFRATAALVVEATGEPRAVAAEILEGAGVRRT